MGGGGQPLDDAKVRTAEGVERSQPLVERLLGLALHPIGINGERLLILHPQRHRRHRVGLQFGQAKVDKAPQGRRGRCECGGEVNGIELDVNGATAIFVFGGSRLRCRREGQRSRPARA